MFEKKIKECIEVLFERRIKNRPDCEELSRHIFEKTNLMISYNTLRRFFGLAGNQSTHISPTSLDIVSVYCGFKSFSDFCANANTLDQQINFYENYSKVAELENFTIASIEAIINAEMSKEEQYSIMSYIVTTAFNRKEVAFLKRLFQLQSVFSGEHHFHSHLYFLILTIGHQLKKFPEFAPELWQSWAKCEKARFYYFELFVDTSSLVSSHYIGIEYYLKYSSTNQDLVFANSLLAWRFLMLGDIEGAKNQISNLDPITELEQIHPIPIARFLNCKLLIEFCEKGEVSNELLTEIRQLQDYFTSTARPDFEHFLCDGLGITKCYHLAISFIQAAELKSQTSATFYQKGSIERLKIIESYALYKLGDFKESKKKKEKIGLEKLDAHCRDYDSLFYYALDKVNCPSEVMDQIHSNKYDILFEKL
jgi:hypothetical protein